MPHSTRSPVAVQSRPSTSRSFDVAALSAQKIAVLYEDHECHNASVAVRSRRSRVARGSEAFRGTRARRELLQNVRPQSKRDVERFVACLRPQPALPATARRLPSPRRTTGPDVGSSAACSDTLPALLPAAPAAAPPVTRAVVAPLAPQRYKMARTFATSPGNIVRCLIYPDGNRRL
jgi:hypothetical protein